MTRLAEVIVRIVESHSGLISNDLCMKVMSEINPTKWDSREYCEAIDYLVIERKIVELPFVIPGKIIRVGSVYFPVGTRIGKEFTRQDLFQE